MSTLHNGMTGNSVIEWQELLIKAGYQLPKYGVDGQYGQETANATGQFQQDMAITVDGIVGIQTLQAMKVRLGMAEPESIPQSGGQMNLDDLTDVYKQETGSIVAPTQRKFLSIPALATVGLGLWFAKKKKWF
jgi:peptidoglycan hydrolase-like protein with peptidoglycan-binding domain